MAAKRNRWIAAGSACLALAWSAECPAQVIGEGRPVAGSVDQGAMITLDVADRPLEDVLDHLRTKVGVTIVSPVGVDSRVTIKLRDVPWTEALVLIAENAGCIATQESPKLWRVEKPPRVTMAFQAEDIKKVIEAVAKYGNANIVVSDKVKGSVTMVINDRPWRDALEAVVKTYGFFLVQEDRGILRVVDEAGLSTHVERRLFPLRYLRPKGSYVARIETAYIETRQDSKGTAGAGAGQSIAEQTKRRFPLLEALEKMKSEKGDLDYLEDQNAILVRDTKPVLDEIGKFLERLDVEPAQIHIDVRFVTTTNNSARDLSFGFDNGFSASLSGAKRDSRYPFNLGPGSFADNLLPGRTNDNAGIGNTFSPVVPGSLDFSATSLAIRLIKEDRSAQIIQAPTITTVDHREATIFVGEQVPYAEAEAASSQSGGLELTIREGADSPVDTGFQLLVIPHVVPGTNKVLMNVIPQARVLTGTSDPDHAGFDLFEVGAGAAGSGSIQLPRVGEQTIVTNLMLENGQTGIVGGLIQNTTNKSETKVPGLGDIPLIGELFKSTLQSEDERKLLVFITPWIVEGSEKTNDKLDAVIESYQRNAALEWDEMASGSS
jgi:type IV pilus assembly protein PilQ